MTFMNNYNFEADRAKHDRILAIRSHTLGLTDTCPQCEEKASH